MGTFATIRVAILVGLCLFCFQNCGDPKPPASSTSSSSESEFTPLAVRDLPYKPRILSQPDNYNRVQGQQVSIKVEIQEEYAPSARIYWYHNGSKIANQQGKTLHLKNLLAENAGTYHAVITVGTEVLTSQTSTLTVVDLKGGVHGNGKVSYNSANQLMNLNWNVTAFGNCSVPCGMGTKSREVSCLVRPENSPVQDSLCTTQKPESSSECEGVNCSTRHSFTNYGGTPANPATTFKMTRNITVTVPSKSSEQAERLFSGQCDQGQLGCGHYDHCEYVPLPDFGDDGTSSFCTLENGNYICTAICLDY